MVVRALTGPARKSWGVGVSAVTVALAPLTVLGPAPQAVGASTLPTGFALRDTATGQGDNNLTDFGFLPDGSALTIGKSGRVTWVPRAGGSPTTIRTFSTETQGDLGLVGLGIAPDYRKSHHIYLIRAVKSTPAPPYPIRLSRFTVLGGSRPTGLTKEKVLFEVRAIEHTHGMTTVLPARDGTLWVSIGDLRTYTRVAPLAVNAMIIGRPAGKLLHVRPNGAGVASNPYYQPAHPSSWRSRTYASGFRSPFRFSLNPVTGKPIVGDVGWSTWEEVDLVQPGGNYKWPCWEGPEQTPGYSNLAACANLSNTAPVWSYEHGTATNQGDSVTGGIVYQGTRYPKPYQGAYFFGDYVGQKLWTMRFTSTGTLVRQPEDPPFGTEIGAPVKFAAAANGDIVYADIASGFLRRLTYAPTPTGLGSGG
jgi:glucose/arabinose dehydrogenase